jgi:hypothetical protein
MAEKIKNKICRLQLPRCTAALLADERLEGSIQKSGLEMQLEAPRRSYIGEGGSPRILGVSRAYQSASECIDRCIDVVIDAVMEAETDICSSSTSSSPI